MTLGTDVFTRTMLRDMKIIMTDAELEEIERYNDDEDVARLIASLRESRARIAELEQKLAANGIEPCGACATDEYIVATARLAELEAANRQLLADAQSESRFLFGRIEKLEAAIERVRALHFPEPGYRCAWCHECGSQYPCPTLVALSTPRAATE